MAEQLSSDYTTQGVAPFFNTDGQIREKETPKRSVAVDLSEFNARRCRSYFIFSLYAMLFLDAHQLYVSSVSSF